MCRFVEIFEDLEGYGLLELSETISEMASWGHVGWYLKVALHYGFERMSSMPSDNEDVRFDQDTCLIRT